MLRTTQSAGIPLLPPETSTEQPLHEDHSAPPAESLAHLNRLREQVLYNVAHELRGPLTVLDNALQMLASDYAELTAVEFASLLQSAQRSVGQLRTLLDDMLSAGIIESGRFTVAPLRMALSAIIQDALEIVGPAVEARGQRIDVRLPSTPLWVQADRRYARQVLTNLLANAAKYSPARSVIRLTAEPAGAAVRVAVADDGPGIPPEHQTALFERFYRLPADDQAPGSGLGLAIAKGIVEAHSGTIGIDSEVGRGTRVWFTLPAAAARHADPPG